VEEYASFLLDKIFPDREDPADELEALAAEIENFLN